MPGNAGGPARQGPWQRGAEFTDRAGGREATPSSRLWHPAPGACQPAGDRLARHQSLKTTPPALMLDLTFISHRLPEFELVEMTRIRSGRRQSAPVTWIPPALTLDLTFMFFISSRVSDRGPAVRCGNAAHLTGRP